MKLFNLAFIGNIGTAEIIVILLIVLLVFGAKRIPELARSLGRATREYKDAKDGVLNELEREPAEKKESAKTDDNSEKNS